MVILQFIYLLSFLICLSQAIPAPQQVPHPQATCDSSWRTRPSKEIFDLLGRAVHEPANEADLQCRKEAAEGLEWAANAAPQTVCPNWLEHHLPHLSACDFAMRLLIHRLGGLSAFPSYGDMHAGTCTGQTYCLPMTSDSSGCRVNLEFDPAVPPQDRKDSEATFELVGKGIYLDLRCAVFL